jgi:hypothetical protein
MMPRQPSNSLRSMRRSLAVLIVAVLSECLWSCNFDSGTPWRSGPYALRWIDAPDDVRLEYRRPDGGSDVRVEARVFAVGRNEHYVVAKQHPGGDRSVTNFFVIDAICESPGSERRDVVRGPLTEAEFLSLSHELGLPPFTKILASLQ